MTGRPNPNSESEKRHGKRVHAINAGAWAVGQLEHGRFRVRRVVWGLLMATAEKRDNEEVRACTILVEQNHRRRKLPTLL